MPATRRGRVAAVVLIAACFLVVPACRKHKNAAAVPPAPQPQTASATPPAARNPPEKTLAKPPAKTLPVALGYTEEGVASWYGHPYHGRHAADGEIYDMETLVAAHRVMPFNTWIRVTNLANQKAVNVRIIDRGPFVEGRILDLSKAAARQIELLGPGTGRVRIEVIASPADIPSDDFYAVQVGAFSVRENAEQARLLYEQRFGAAQLAMRQGSTTMWRVLVGKEPSIEAARKLAATLSAENKEVFVVRLDQILPPPAPNPPQTPTWQSPTTIEPASVQPAPQF